MAGKKPTLEKGAVMSETQFYTVEKTKGDQVQLKNDLGQDIVVNKKYVKDCLVSAHDFEGEEKLSRTEVAAKFLACSNVAVTVNFNKLVKEADVVKEIQEHYEGSTPKDFSKKLKASVKKALNGEERTMVGRHYGSVNEFGRVSFIDMQVAKKRATADYDDRTRQVDPRGINWFICKGVKYSVK